MPWQPAQYSAKSWRPCSIFDWSIAEGTGNGGAGRFQIQVRMRLDGGDVDRHRRHSGAQRGAQIALVHRRVVAVPVQLHPVTRALLPDGRKISGAVQFCLGNVVGAHGEIELDRLVGVERIDPAGTPILLACE